MKGVTAFGLVVSSVFSTAVPSLAKVYYVSTAGSDANVGLQPGSAWASIAKVTGSAFEAGDSILFQPGRTFPRHPHGRMAVGA